MRATRSRKTRGLAPHARLASSPARGERPPSPDEVIAIPLADIAIDEEWNARLPANVTADGDGEDEGIEGLAKSLSAKGQDTPVIVRPTPGLGEPYALVSGFRRCCALKRLAERGERRLGAAVWDPKKPTVRAFVRELGELEARALNLRENAPREALKPPDLAWGIWELVGYAARHDQALTDERIAAELGKTPKYIGHLRRIMRELRPEIARAWRTAPLAVAVDAMREIASLPPDAQEAAFKAALHGKKQPRGAGADLAFAAERRRMTEYGTALAWLARLELDPYDPDFERVVDRAAKERWRTHPEQRASLARAMREAYEEERTKP